MNQKKAKTIRRNIQLNKEIASYVSISHPFILPEGVKYKFQHICTGKKSVYRIAKKIYKLYKILPKQVNKK